MRQMRKRTYQQVTANAAETFLPVIAQISGIDADRIAMVVPGWGSNRVVYCPLSDVNEDCRPHIKLWARVQVEATTFVQPHETVRFRNFRSLEDNDLTRRHGVCETHNVGMDGSR